MFQKLYLFLSSGEGRETPTLCFLVFIIPVDGQNPEIQQFQTARNPKRVLSFWDIMPCNLLKAAINISEKHITSIFRVEEQAKQETSMKTHGKHGGDMFLQYFG
jgi:hypothetical protein